MPKVPEHIYKEIAFIAYHFHWSYDSILAMEHAERRLWCEQISQINKSMNEDASKPNTINLEQSAW